MGNELKQGRSRGVISNVIEEFHGYELRGKKGSSVTILASTDVNETGDLLNSLHVQRFYSNKSLMTCVLFYFIIFRRDGW